MHNFASAKASEKKFFLYSWSNNISVKQSNHIIWHKIAHGLFISAILKNSS